MLGTFRYVTFEKVYISKIKTLKGRFMKHSVFFKSLVTSSKYHTLSSVFYLNIKFTQDSADSVTNIEVICT